MVNGLVTKESNKRVRPPPRLLVGRDDKYCSKVLPEGRVEHILLTLRLPPPPTQTLLVTRQPPLAQEAVNTTNNECENDAATVGNAWSTLRPHRTIYGERHERPARKAQPASTAAGGTRTRPSVGKEPPYTEQPPCAGLLVCQQEGGNVQRLIRRTPKTEFYSF